MLYEARRLRQPTDVAVLLLRCHAIAIRSPITDSSFVVSHRPRHPALPPHVAHPHQVILPHLYGARVTHTQSPRPGDDKGSQESKEDGVAAQAQRPSLSLLDALASADPVGGDEEDEGTDEAKDSLTKGQGLLETPQRSGRSTTQLVQACLGRRGATASPCSVLHEDGNRC